MRGCACVGSLSTVDPQVVQPGTGEHDLVAEGAAKAAASVFDDAAALNPADGMLHDDTLLADPAVKALLYLGQQGLGWLFYGQQGERALQPIALEAQVHAQDAPGREAAGLLDGQPLVTHTPLIGGAQVHNLLSVYTDQVVFEGMVFLLAAVGGLLAGLVFGPLYRAFSSVQAEALPIVLGQHGG